MNKSNLELFGLDENATREMLEAAYLNLRERYRSEMFEEGERGNEAARMLTRLDAAYGELINEFEQMPQGTSAQEAGSACSFEQVEALIRAGKIDDAQRSLDGFNERGAHWHYLQSVIYYRKGWLNESKMQLEIAIQLDPNNTKYNDAYSKLREKASYNSANDAAANQSVYTPQDMNSYGDNQMGDTCSDCATCCAMNLCANCLCNLCCFR